MKQEGFTIVELLVVIAVIALMTAILVPSLRQSKLQAEALLCSANVRQLVFGLTIYEEDNGTFPHVFNNTNEARSTPPAGGHAGDPMQDSVGWWWFDYTADYRKRDADKDSVIWCPSRVTTDRRLTSNVLCANYGVNQSVCKKTGGKRKCSEFAGRPLSSCEIRRQSESLLIIDSGYAMINWGHVTDVPAKPSGNSIKDCAYVPGLKMNKDKKLWPGLEWDATTGRHPNNTVNAGFVDGHIERRGADDFFVEGTEDSYKNLHPLWQPVKTFEIRRPVLLSVSQQY
jgi:general secretion pathway protein G